MFDVSVIIPVFNRVATITRAIASVLSQSESALEIIVVDDGSTDGTATAVAAIGDHRIRLVRQPNGGAGSARNRGMALARGEWIAFLDSDDEWRTDRIRSARGLLDARSSIDFLQCGRTYVRADGTRSDDLKAGIAEMTDAQALLSGFTIKTSAVMVRRALIEAHALRFPEKRKTCEDYDLFWRAIMVSRAIGYSPHADVIVHLGPDGLSRDDDESGRLRDDLDTLVSVRRWALSHAVDPSLVARVTEHLHWTVRDGLVRAIQRRRLRDGLRHIAVSLQEEGMRGTARGVASAFLGRKDVKSPKWVAS